MGRSSGGYTIIEVMIVLAISSVLMISALVVFSGSQRDTQFNQSMQDISSKMQSYASEITSGNYPGSEGYNCSVATSGSYKNYPVLAVGPGSNESCIFLGRTLQFQIGQSTFNSYIVLGTRDAYSGGSDTGTASLSVDTSHPITAVSNTGTYYTNLIESYTMGSVHVGTSLGGVGGAKPATEYDLIGVYSDLETAVPTGSSPVVTLRGYNFSGAVTPSSTLTSCIQEISCTPVTLSQWNLCLTDGKQTSILEVKPGAGGLTTDVVTATSC